MFHTGHLFSTDAVRLARPLLLYWQHQFIVCYIYIPSISNYYLVYSWNHSWCCFKSWSHVMFGWDEWIVRDRNGVLDHIVGKCSKFSFLLPLLSTWTKAQTSQFERNAPFSLILNLLSNLIIEIFLSLVCLKIFTPTIIASHYYYLFRSFPFHSPQPNMYWATVKNPISKSSAYGLKNHIS